MGCMIPGQGDFRQNTLILRTRRLYSPKDLGQVDLQMTIYNLGISKNSLFYLKGMV